MRQSHLHGKTVKWTLSGTAFAVPWVINKILSLTRSIEAISTKAFGKKQSTQAFRKKYLAFQSVDLFPPTSGSQASSPACIYGLVVVDVRRVVLLKVEKNIHFRYMSKNARFIFRYVFWSPSKTFKHIFWNIPEKNEKFCISKQNINLFFGKFGE